jgi:uncharacterized protein (DUF885 family)
MTPLPAAAAGSTLRSLADTFWERYLAFNPTFATIMGDRRYDDRVEDPAPAAIAAQRAEYAALLAQTEAVQAASLGPVDRVTRSMLIDELRGAIDALGSGLERWTVDPMNGPQVVYLDLPDLQPIRTPAEGDAMVERWRAVATLLDRHVENLRDGLRDGLVAVRQPVERVIDEIRGLEATPVTGWPPLRSLDGPPAGWAESERGRFREHLETVVARDLLPALSRYRSVLEDEILPAARPQDRPGLMHLAGGPETYRSLVRVHTTLDLSPDEIHRIGLDEIARIDAEFAELGARALGARTRRETLDRLRDDPALRFRTGDEVLAAADAALRRAEAAIPDWFGRLPRAGCAIVPIPKHAEAHQTLAYYQWPALDGSRPGQYFINLHGPETRARYEAEALAFHESVPGHHLQIALVQELEGLPAFQRNLGSTAFAEGWGLYTERLADEMGLYSSDVDRFGILSFDAWRAGRLVVDTGMHALGWSRQRAIDFLAEHTALDAGNVANEVDRYIVWPAQALGYKIGQLEILRLRAEARSALGPAFSVKGFHDAVLGSGAVSLGTLGEIVRAWVAESSGGRTPSGSPVRPS